MKKLLILFSLINLTVSGQVINLQRDTIYWYNDMPLSVIKIGEDIRYNQYPVAVIDSLTGNTPGDTLRAYATSTDRDGDSTYSLYRFGYSTDSLGAITWLNNWSPADTMTIPDAMTGKFPVVSVLPKALTGGRTGREVYAWGDSVYSADMYNFYADTLFARMSATPTDSFKFAVNRLLTRLYVANVLDSADIYRVIAAPDTQVAKMNLVSRDFTATILGTESFTKYQGYTGNGSNFAIQSNFIPSVNGVHYRLNSASIHVWNNNNNIVNNKMLTGVSDGTNWIEMNVLTTDLRGRVNNTIAGGSYTPAHGNNIVGGITIKRDASNTIKMQRNDGYFTTSGTVNSSALPSKQIYSLAFNNNGSTGNISTNQLSFIYIGGALTDAMAVELFNAEKEYLEYFGTIFPTTTVDVTVKKDGTEDYTSIADALVGITDASRWKIYNIHFSESFTSKGQLQMKNYVNIIGADTATSKIICELPDDTTEAAVIATAAIRCSGINFTIRNCHISVQNGRYAVHNDAGAVNIYPAITQNFINCKFEHKGNVGVDTYHSKTVFEPIDAYGCGLSGNVNINIDSCVAITAGTIASKSRGLAFHAATSSVLPAIVTIRNTECYSAAKYGLRVGMLFNNKDEYHFTNVSLYKPLYIDGSGTYTNNTTITGTNPQVLNGTIICD